MKKNGKIFVCVIFAISSFILLEPPYSSSCNFFYISLVVLLLLTSVPKASFSLRAFVLLLALFGLFSLFKKSFSNVEIEEGHNLFFVSHERDPFSGTMPLEFYQYCDEELTKVFEDVFLENPLDIKNNWNKYYVPLTEFAFSSESILNPAKYSRIVRGYRRNSHSKEKFGFINDRRFSFEGEFASLRYRLPHFKMWEVSNKIIGLKLNYSGVIFFENANGIVSKLESKDCDYITLGPDDLGGRFWCARVFEFNDMWITLDQNRSISEFFSRGIELLYILLCFSLLFNTDHRRVSAGLLFGVSLLVFYHTNSDFFLNHPPLWAGGDGLVHEGFGYDLVKRLSEGNWHLFLKGKESVYYYMPFYRYFRALEDVIFGDVNYLVVLTTCFVPVSLFYLLSRFMGRKIAFWISFFALFNPWYLSFPRYIEYCVWGLIEPVVLVFVLVGIGMCFDYVKRESRTLLVLLSFMFGITIFLRPNYILIVGPLLLSFSILLFRSRKWNRIAGLYFCFFSIVLLMPLHNWFYGKEFVLFTSSLDTVVQTDFNVCYKACIDLCKADFDSIYVRHIIRVCSDWLMDVHHPKYSPIWVKELKYIFVLGKIVAVLIFLKSFVQNRGSLLIFSLHFGVLLSHLSLFFLRPYGRWSLFSWDMLVICVIITLLSGKGYEKNHGSLFKLP